MPVHLEWIESPSEQDWIDLNKLYKDAPAHWCLGDAENPGQDYLAQKQQQGCKLVAGRFNDRLIAAAALRVNTDKVNAYYIEDLCVRALTRERGVAKQLLVRICQWSDQQKCSLWVKDESAQLRALMALGFVHDGGQWYRQG
ncbi:MAG: acetyl-CoA sensor PanZ family protein [Bermanella sp.]